MWGYHAERDGEHGSKVVAFPCECKDCPTDSRKLYGCGDGYEGQSEVKYEYGATEHPWDRTCPQFYLRQPWVQELFSLVKDYKRSALGNVLDLDAALLDYLRVIEAEQDVWKAQQDEQMREKQQ